MKIHSSSLAMFAAILRASSLLSNLAAGAACPLPDLEWNDLGARLDVSFTW